MLCKRYEKRCFWKKEGSGKCSVQGIFQSGGMTGIEALKCFGSEDKTGERETNLLREPQIVLYYWTLRKSKIKTGGLGKSQILEVLHVSIRGLNFVLLAVRRH